MIIITITATGTILTKTAAYKKQLKKHSLNISSMKTSEETHAHNQI